MKVILVGVNHAGTSFIRTAKRLNPEIEIHAYDRNTDISFLGCGIALWVGGEFKDPEGLFYSSPQELRDSFGVDVKMEHDIIEINTKGKYVVVKDLKTGKEFKDEYDKLVYAGGSWPITIPAKNRELENIVMSKLFAHAKFIHEKNNDKSVKNVVVIGAGYIGIELVEAFHKAGKKVVLIDMLDRVIARQFDHEFTDLVEAKMEKLGIAFHPHEKVMEYKGTTKVEAVVTDKGEYKADLVIECAGFYPQTKMLEGQVKLFDNKSIIVDNEQRSSNKDVYAIGDSCALEHHVLKRAHVALATNAVKTGLVAAFSIAAPQVGIKFPGVNGTSAISIFGFKYAATGISEETAKHFNIDHKVAVVKDKDRPTWMQNSEDVMFKLVYDPKTLKILGAQIGSWGQHNHTETIYAISLAISQGLTVPALALMDVFFLPHFNQPFNYMILSVLQAIGMKY